LKSEETRLFRDAYLFYSKIISISRIIKQYGSADYKNYDMLSFILEDKHIKEKIEHYKILIIVAFNGII